MKMKSKLSTKFIITFTAALTFIFLIMLGAVQISMNVYMRGYIRDSIYSFHEDLDKSVVAVIDEVAYTYARMTRPENALTLDGLGSGNSYAAEAGLTAGWIPIISNGKFSRRKPMHCAVTVLHATTAAAGL